MKKILSFLMALTMVLGLNAAPVALKQQKAPKSTSRMELVQKQKVARKAPMATTVTLDPATQTPQTEETDIELTVNGIDVVYHGTLNAATDYAPADFRIYGGKTLTLSASSNIVSVTIAGKANKAGFTLSVDNGTITTGASYTDITEKATLEDPLIVIDDINATSVELSMGKQVRAYLIEVTLDGEVPPTPPTPVGDTTALTALDAFEFGYYGSYSEEGAYNYTLVLYNSQDDYYIPQVGLDIYTEVKDEFAGNFTAEDGNLGLEYSAFYPDADSEGEYFSAASVSVTEGEGDNLIVEGIFTTEAGKTYTFSVTAEPYIYDAEHPYEPQEAKTFNLTSVEGELDETYFAEYGLVYYYLYMEDGSVVGLTYRTANGTEPEGTFAISDEEGADAFLTGMDYYGYADGSYYETIDGDVYYFISGSVTLATDEAGNTTINVNATSVYGSTFTISGVIGGSQPSGDHTIVIADYASTGFTTLDGAYTVASNANGGTSAPAYNANGEDLRLYAKNTMTLTKNTKDGPMTKVIFYISDKGLARQAEITPSVGKMAYDMTAATVTWTGNASEVTFTVGEKAVYGTDGDTKAGQFDFTAIDIEYAATGLISTKANKVADKCFINGQLMIIKNDAIYNFQGQLVK